MSEKINKDTTMRRIIILAIIILTIYAGYNFGKWVTEQFVSKQPATPTISMSAAKGAFMSGCTSVKNSEVYLTETQQYDYCSCSWDGLVALHGDKLLTDKSIMKRANETGFNAAETDVLVKCVEPYIE